uniref:Uncharacterized protein n=1 Tax=Cucumis melo TaxID=3656 RepID=A0A9I9EAQ7_CUCME
MASYKTLLVFGLLFVSLSCLGIEGNEEASLHHLPQTSSSPKHHRKYSQSFSFPKKISSIFTPFSPLIRLSPIRLPPITIPPIKPLPPITIPPIRLPPITIPPIVPVPPIRLPPFPFPLRPPPPPPLSPPSPPRPNISPIAYRLVPLFHQ